MTYVVEKVLNNNVLIARREDKEVVLIDEDRFGQNAARQSNQTK